MQRKFTCFVEQQWVRENKILQYCVQSNHVPRVRLIVKMVNEYVDKKFFIYICGKIGNIVCTCIEKILNVFFDISQLFVLYICFNH